MARTRAGLPSLVACTPFPALVLFQGVNGKLKKIKKKKEQYSNIGEFLGAEGSESG